MTALLFLLLVGQHEVTELNCPDQVDHRVARDLNGDGIDDLMVISGKAAWIWHGRANGFPAAPDQRIRLEDGAAMFDVYLGELIVRYPKHYKAMYPKRRTLPYASGPGLPADSSTLTKSLLCLPTAFTGEPSRAMVSGSTWVASKSSAPRIATGMTPLPSTNL